MRNFVHAVIVTLLIAFSLATAGITSEEWLIVTDRWGGHKFDAQSGRYLGDISLPTFITIGPNHIVYSCSGNGSYIGRTDLFTGQFLGYLHAGYGEMWGTAFGPDGLLYASHSDQGIYRYDTSTGVREKLALPSNMSVFRGLDFGTDGTMYVGCTIACLVGGKVDMIRSVARIDTETLEILETYPSTQVTQAPTGISCSPDGSVYVTDQCARSVSKLNPVTGKMELAIEALPHAGITDVAWRTDGTTFVAALADNPTAQVTVYDPVTRTFTPFTTEYTFHDPSSLTVVTVSEPGSIAALFAGLVGLLGLKLKRA